MASLRTWDWRLRFLGSIRGLPLFADSPQLQHRPFLIYLSSVEAGYSHCLKLALVNHYCCVQLIQVRVRTHRWWQQYFSSLSNFQSFGSLSSCWSCVIGEFEIQFVGHIDNRWSFWVGVFLLVVSVVQINPSSIDATYRLPQIIARSISILLK